MSTYEDFYDAIWDAVSGLREAAFAGFKGTDAREPLIDSIRDDYLKERNALLELTNDEIWIAGAFNNYILGNQWSQGKSLAEMADEDLLALRAAIFYMEYRHKIPHDAMPAILCNFWNDYIMANIDQDQQDEGFSDVEKEHRVIDARNYLTEMLSRSQSVDLPAFLREHQ